MLMQWHVQAESGASQPLTLLHRKAEDTHLPAGSFDVVSMCLLAHELPQHATQAILREAYRCALKNLLMKCLNIHIDAHKVGRTLLAFKRTLNSKRAAGAAFG
jgi:ubiquinone/menaquinone biosynthesis C-methylase UbiE